MKKTTLHLLDEVNCKFEDLDLDTRKALVSAFKIFQPHAKYQARYRLGQWDGCVSFFGLGGVTYINLLDQIIPILVERGYEIEVNDTRVATNLSFDEVTVDFWGDQCWPEGHRFAGKPIELRQDQADAINIYLSNPHSMQELTTSFGKTITCATMSKACEKYGRTLLIVPNRSLVEQTLEDYKNVGLDVGLYYGAQKDYDKTHTICTWQSLNILEKKAKNSQEDIDRLCELLSGVNTVIIDEVHSAKSEVLHNILTKMLAHAEIRWGLTGTIPKDKIDQIRLLCSIGPVVNRVTAKELQEQGFLSNCHVKILQTQEYRTFNDYRAELDYLVKSKLRVDWLSAQIHEIAKSGNTLVLVNLIDTGESIVENLKSLTVDQDNITFISGNVKSKDRKDEYDKIANSDNNIIVATFGVAAVGINIPRIFNVVMIEPGKSFVRVIQSIGRGLRRAEDKDFVQIWDLTANTKYAKRHLTERKRFYNDANYEFEVIKVNTRLD